MARSRPTPPLAQHGLRQLRAPGSDSGTRRGGHGHRGATTPTLAVLAVWLPAASPRSTSSSGSDTADAGTHGYQTLTPDTRRRTPGHRTPGRSDADTGHWTPVAWTSHARTPDAGRGRTRTGGPRHGRHPDILGPPRRAAAPLGRRSVFLWMAPAALGSPCKLGGEATCQPETTYRATSCSAAPPAKARLGALLSCVGWYEGRAMGLRKGEGVRGRVGEAMLMAVLQ
jgi:hypothetical protein